jgi:succinate dehydrogenase/fumarate reductase flavoprotein subunit
MGWNAMIERYKWSDDNSVELAKGWIIKADTIRELAAKIGKNPDTLEKTLATWNKSCAAGNDSEFGRPSDRIAPIQTPPYYALELVPTFTNTQGGPRRNKNAQILDPYGKPIPRLYSAGELGSLWSWNYQGAGDFAECLAFGRIAGEHAAAEKPWS